MTAQARRGWPARWRDFRGRRWLNILLRSLHLVGVAGMGGGLLYGAASAHWMPYLWLTVVTGLLMLLVEVSASRVFVLQLRGIAVLVKLLLLVAILTWPYLGPGLLVAVVVISGVFSHAPAEVRYYSPLHRRVI